MSPLEKMSSSRGLSKLSHLNRAMETFLFSLLSNEANTRASKLVRPSLLYQEISDGRIRPVSPNDVVSMVTDYVSGSSSSSSPADDTSYLASKRNMFDPLTGSSMAGK